MARRVGALGVVLLATALLVGCSKAGDSEGFGPSPRATKAPAPDLREAKQNSLELLRAAMSVVPPEERQSEWLNDPGVLLSCRGDAWSWNTNGEIDFGRAGDLAVWLDDVAEVVERDFGASTSSTIDDFGHVNLDIVLDDGTHSSADVSREGERLRFSVYSPCVTDLADYYETPKPAGGY